MSMSKVKVTRYRFPFHLKCTAMRSLKITSYSSRQDHSVAAEGVIGVHRQRGRSVIHCGLRAVYVW